MNYIEEMNLATKIKYDNDFAYVLNNNDLFLSTEYKVIQSQTDDSFIKCMKLLYNGKIQLYYLTEECKSLESIISSINEENFIIVIINLFTSIMNVKNNGFLSIQNIDISFEHIFVENATYKVRLIYLPIYKEYDTNQFNFEKVLRNNLIKLVKDAPFMISPKIKQLLDNLENTNLSFDDLNIKLKENFLSIKGTKKIINDSQHINHLKIVSINAPVYMEFNITKNEFILGFKKELVDGVISYNKKISRVHCKINKYENQYTIMDLDSSNGTYVNNIRLHPHNPYIIKNDDIVRLANSEFKVIIE